MRERFGAATDESFSSFVDGFMSVRAEDVATDLTTWITPRKPRLRERES